MNEKILLVDDNALMLRNMKRMLEHEYQLELATSAAKAFMKIGVEKPDLILLDYEMPVCDGKQFYEMLLAEETLKDIPVVFLTGVKDWEHIQSVLAMKPQGYVLKPPVEDKILTKVREVLENKEIE